MSLLHCMMLRVGKITLLQVGLGVHISTKNPKQKSRQDATYKLNCQVLYKYLDRMQPQGEADENITL